MPMSIDEVLDFTACLPACLSASLPARLAVCFSNCLPVCLCICYWEKCTILTWISSYEIRIAVNKSLIKSAFNFFHGFKHPDVGDCGPNIGELLSGRRLRWLIFMRDCAICNYYYKMMIMMMTTTTMMTVMTMMIILIIINDKMIMIIIIKKINA